MLNYFGIALSKVKDNYGLSTQDVALAAGVTITSVSFSINGHRGTVSLFRKITGFMRLSAEDEAELSDAAYASMRCHQVDVGKQTDIVSLLAAVVAQGIDCDSITDKQALKAIQALGKGYLVDKLGLKVAK